MKERVIIYALGYYWNENWKKLKEQYDIIACSDRNPEAAKLSHGFKFILPQQIREFIFDKIIVCSIKEGIRELFVLQYNIPKEKILHYRELNNEKRVCKKNKSHEEKLTVVIPTYNREERLKRTLDILQIQTDSDFKIIILDNCSDYDIYSVIKERDVKFQDKVTIVKNKKNIGMAGNLANAFIQETKGWIWTLADDDIPSIYAIEDIYEEIEKQKGVGAISFLIYDFKEYMERNFVEVANLSELVTFYQGIIDKGANAQWLNNDMIFFSKYVFNMEIVQQYCADIFTYSYTGVPFLVAILMMLNEKKAVYKICNKKIVEYDSPNGDHWNVIKAISGIRTIMDLPIDMTEEEKKFLYKLIVINHISFFALMKDKKLTDYELMQIEKIYEDTYKYYYTDEEKKDFITKLEEVKGRQ